MKKVTLTPEEITLRLKEKYPKSNNVCDGEFNGGYFILTHQGARLYITKQKIYAEMKPEDKPEDCLPTQVITINGSNYLMFKHEQANEIKEICGFKSAKTEVTLKQKIANHWQAQTTKLSVNDLHSFYRTITGYMDEILREFKTVKISLKMASNSNDAGELLFKYYRGAGKTFHEGAGKMKVEAIDLDLLIPELEAVASKYNRTITRYQSQLMVA